MNQYYVTAQSHDAGGTHDLLVNAYNASEAEAIALAYFSRKWSDLCRPIKVVAEPLDVGCSSVEILVGVKNILCKIKDYANSDSGYDQEIADLADVALRHIRSTVVTDKALRGREERIRSLSAEVRERRDQVEEYQQREDEIIVALGAEGILPSGIVGKINELRDDRDHVSQLLLDVGNEAIASTLELPENDSRIFSDVRGEITECPTEFKGKVSPKIKDIPANTHASARDVEGQ